MYFNAAFNTYDSQKTIKVCYKNASGNCGYIIFCSLLTG